MGKYLFTFRLGLYAIFGVVAGGAELSFSEFIVLLLLAAGISAISNLEGRIEA